MTCQNNTLITDSNGRTYTIYCNADTNGGAFANQQFGSGDFTQCDDACDATSGCGAWVWVTYGPGAGGVCYFKTPPQSYVAGSNIAGILWQNASMASASSSMAASSSTVSPSASPSLMTCVNNTQNTDANGKTYTIYCDSDTTGGAFANDIYSSGDFTQCEIACDAASGCGAWTWVPYNNGGGVCYLKQAPSSPVPNNPGYVGGILDASQPSSSSSAASSASSSSSSAVASV